MLHVEPALPLTCKGRDQADAHKQFRHGCLLMLVAGSNVCGYSF
jgi:hypothetical protein